jgi:hypothetical protein
MTLNSAHLIVDECERLDDRILLSDRFPSDAVRMLIFALRQLLFHGARPLEASIRDEWVIVFRECVHLVAV